MADIQAVNTLDGTTLNCELTLTFSQRTSSSVKVSYRAVTYLNSSGYTGAGYEAYKGVIRIWGNNVTEKTLEITLKEKSESWSGSEKHTKTGSFTLSLNTQGAVYPKISYTVTSTADTGNCVYGETALTCPSFKSPVPLNPALVSVSQTEVYYGMAVSITFSQVDSASGYRIYKSVNGGAFSLAGTVASSPFKYTVEEDFTQKITFKVCPYNSSGAAAGKKSPELTVGGGLWEKVAGKWKPCNPYVKVSGTWRRVKCVYIKINGSWCMAK